MSSLQPEHDIPAAADTTAATCHQSRESIEMRRSRLTSTRAISRSGSGSTTLLIDTTPNLFLYRSGKIECSTNAQDSLESNLLTPNLNKMKKTVTLSLSYLFVAFVVLAAPCRMAAQGSSGKITVRQEGAYVVSLKLTYTQNGKTIVAKDQQGLPHGWRDTFVIPADATNIALEIKADTGRESDRWRTVYSKTWPTPSTEYVEVTGTVLNPKWRER